MRRRSRLPTLVRLARVNEMRALREFAIALRQTEAQRIEFSTVEAAMRRAELESFPEAGHPVPAGVLRSALERASASAQQAATIRPRLAAAESHLERSREAVAQERLRTRALEKASARREAEERIARQRKESQRMDDRVRFARQRLEGDGE